MSFKDAGIVGYVNKGEWQIDTEYEMNNVVSHNGSLWSANIANTTEPTEENSDWMRWIAGYDTIDEDLSETSTNPVMNKTITKLIGSTDISQIADGTITGAISAKQNTITGGATSITSNNLTASRALVSNSSGKVAVSAVTSTELGYLGGVTSAIQTQLGNKMSVTAGSSAAVTVTGGQGRVTKIGKVVSGYFWFTKSSSAAAGSTVGTLPAGYYPASKYTGIAIKVNSGGTCAGVAFSISTAGKITNDTQWPSDGGALGFFSFVTA